MRHPNAALADHGRDPARSGAQALCALVLLGAVACSPDAPDGAPDTGAPDTATPDAAPDIAPPADSDPGDAALPDTGVSDVAGPFAPNPRLVDLPDNTVLDLGAVECGSPMEPTDYGCRGIVDFSGMAYDPSREAMLAWGGGHATTMADAIQALDVADTLTWRDLYPTTQCDEMTPDNLDPSLGAWRTGVAGPYPRPVSAHSYDLVIYAPDQDELVLVGRFFTHGYCSFDNDISGPIAHYRMSAGVWEFSDEPSPAGLPAGAFDPVSRHIVVIGQAGMVVYDPATRRVVSRVSEGQRSDGSTLDLGALGYAGNLTYAPITDRFYYMDDGRVWEVAPERDTWAGFTVDELAVSGTGPIGESGYAYDDRNAVIGGGVADSVFYIFDPRARAWTSQRVEGGTPGGTGASHMVAYSPLNNVFVFRTDYVSGRHAWAYRYRR